MGQGFYQLSGDVLATKTGINMAMSSDLGSRKYNLLHYSKGVVRIEISLCYKKAKYKNNTKTKV